MMKLKCFIILSLLLIFTGSAFAQFQTIPVTPQYQLPTSPTQPTQLTIEGQTPTLQQLPPQPAQVAPPQQPQIFQKPPAEKPSVFGASCKSLEINLKLKCSRKL